MKRRTFLGWVCQLMSSACLLIIAVPAVQFVIAPLKKKKNAEASAQRVARLQQLSLGLPAEFPVMGNRRDAWTLHENNVIGRVWIIVRSTVKDSPEQTEVEAYSSICPHLRCTVQMASNKKEFFCPCHKAVFALDGHAVASEKLGYTNPAPRGMDSLPCQVVQDQQTKEWWVEVEYQKFKTGLVEKVVET